MKIYREFQKEEKRKERARQSRDEDNKKSAAP